ncbi:MAG: glutaredoxin domain-containing protein [candidate division WOR-3 bacterium]
MKVKIYSTPTCPYCEMAKDFLNENHIAFEDINVAADQQKAQEMVEKSGQFGVPVIDIDGQIVIGFDRPRIARLLNIKE